MARNQEQEQKWDRRNARAGEWLDSLLAGHGTEGLDEGEIHDIRVRFPTEGDPGVLLIVRAHNAAGRWVAFVGGPDVVTALLIWRQKDSSSGLRWNVDKPWDGKAK